MEIQVRPVREEEFEDYFRAAELAFGEPAREHQVRRFGRLHGHERALAAFDDDAIVGTAGAFAYSMSVPGSEVAAAGITAVGVAPSHRRKGILRTMMRRQLDDIHERNEPVAVLWSSEAPIYARYGYGLASWQGRIRIERLRARFRGDPAPAGRHRILPLDAAAKVLPTVYDRVRAMTPGMMARSHEHWTLWRLSDEESEREGYGPMFCDIWEIDGRAEGYALYRTKNQWRDGLPTGEAEVVEAMGTSALATREVWRFIFGLDLVDSVEAWWLPLDHPLMFLLDEPDRLRFRMLDALWVRIVEVAGALRARRYDDDGVLIFDLADAFCPRNAGRWRVVVDEGRAHVRRTDEEPQLRMDVAELGALYLGGIRARHLGAAGLIEELQPGALRRADRMFQSDRMPWCPQIF